HCARSEDQQVPLRANFIGRRSALAQVLGINLKTIVSSSARRISRRGTSIQIDDFVSAVTSSARPIVHPPHSIELIKEDQTMGTPSSIQRRNSTRRVIAGTVLAFALSVPAADFAQGGTSHVPAVDGAIRRCVDRGRQLLRIAQAAELEPVRAPRGCSEDRQREMTGSWATPKRTRAAYD